MKYYEIPSLYFAECEFPLHVERGGLGIFKFECKNQKCIQSGDAIEFQAEKKEKKSIMYLDV